MPQDIAEERFLFRSVALPPMRGADRDEAPLQELAAAFARRVVSDAGPSCKPIVAAVDGSHFVDQCYGIGAWSIVSQRMHEH